MRKAKLIRTQTSAVRFRGHTFLRAGASFEMLNANNEREIVEKSEKTPKEIRKKYKKHLKKAY